MSGIPPIYIGKHIHTRGKAATNIHILTHKKETLTRKTLIVVAKFFMEGGFTPNHPKRPPILPSPTANKFKTVTHDKGHPASFRVGKTKSGRVYCRSPPIIPAVVTEPHSNQLKHPTKLPIPQNQNNFSSNDFRHTYQLNAIAIIAHRSP